ncbi:MULTISPECIES: MarR family winged helix-turn-helix transcriptional regulator [unclassified Isoptericola]|uniref:MarR family winged helix-turn-helix transcriptional regulator n=1 Tax=Isoptericola sp. NPDC057191 TaxID=3346041 RepID=UPI003644AE99
MTQAPTTGASYWYGEDDAEPRLLLEALRAFRRSDEAMRRRAGRDMNMNLTDLRALQHAIACEERGEPATPRGLAEYLAISTASTTKLLDRLVASGHLQRHAHPTDRRSVVVTASKAAHDEVRERLASVHDRMLQTARAVPAHCRPAVREFLLAMAAEAEREPDDAAGAVVGDATS